MNAPRVRREPIISAGHHIREESPISGGNLNAAKDLPQSPSCIRRCFVPVRNLEPFLEVERDGDDYSEGHAMPLADEYMVLQENIYQT